MNINNLLIQIKHEVTTIQAKNHKLFTVELEKKSLSPFNDKKMGNKRRR